MAGCSEGFCLGSRSGTLRLFALHTRICRDVLVRSAERYGLGRQFLKSRLCEFGDGRLSTTHSIQELQVTSVSTKIACSGL
jgi:hypothetical protein